MAASTTATPSKLEAQLTGKAKQLEEDHAKGKSEAERLREEVNRTRALRANRAANRSQKSISSMSGVMSPTSPSITSPPQDSSSSAVRSNTTDAPSTTHTNSQHPTIQVEPEHKIKVHASSYPVFTGRVNNNNNNSATSPGGGGVSLANFIGGDTRIKGPILNKARPPIEESYLTKEERTTPQATFLSRNPALLPQHQQHLSSTGGSRSHSPGVALPGMIRAKPSTSPSLPPSSTTAVPPKSPSLSDDTSADKTTTEKSLTDSTISASANSKSSFFGASPTSPKPAYDRFISKSPAPMDKLSLDDKKEDIKPSSSVSASASSVIASPRPVQAFGSSPLSPKPDQGSSSSSSAQAPNTEDTTSLGRLRGASIVKQRLQWGEVQKDASTQSSSPSSISYNRYTPSNSPKPTSHSAFKLASAEQSEPSASSASVEKKGEEQRESTKTPIQTQKRSSVLDRWNRDIPNQNTSVSTSASASPQASPKVDSTTSSKWPKPSYSRPVLGNKPSWSSSPAPSPSHKTDLPGAETKPEGMSTSPRIEQPEMEFGSTREDGSKTDISGTDEPKTFQRPSTKPPWMQSKTSSVSPSVTPSDNSSTSAPPTRSSTYPKPQIVTSNFSSSSSYTASPSRSPVPSSPKPSRSMPSPSLPISVSPTPYVRSSAPSPASATSPRTSVFQPSATSFPVSLGVAPTHSRPLSLAHFIGGDKQVNGPVLNKVRPEETDGYGLETDATSPNARVGTFLTHNPGVLNEFMMKKQKVPMPGMVPASSTSLSKSPTPLSPKSHREKEIASSSMEKKISNSGSLPLPGMQSPKLPLPGDDASFSPAHGDDKMESSKSMSQSGDHGVPSPETAGLSSESTVLSEEVTSRPSTKSISHHFEKHDDMEFEDGQASRRVPAEKQISPSSEENPWAAIGSAMLSSPASPTSPDEGEATIKPPSSSRHKPLPTWEGTLKTLGKGPARHAPTPPSKENTQSASKAANDPIVVRKAAIRREDIPDLNISQIPAPPSSPIAFQQYVSVDVISITDESKNTTVPPREQHIFYSTELLAIILRSKQGGLVSTEIVVWKGKHCSEDGREKIEELEKRYRTAAVHVSQGKENLQLVKALGGRLVTRQGFRNSFDVLNSTLYRVHMRGKGLSFIDEVELQASSLCSAYSYIASVFQDLFVWYGRGTPDEESRIALQFAEELSKAGPGPKRKVVHMLEGQESELWREIMGREEEYAFANHWRFRLDHSKIALTPIQFYEVTSPNARMVLLGEETSCSPSDNAVLIAKTPLEFFVIVTPSARGDAGRIARALRAAEVLMKAHPKHASPFRPTLHTLVLPSLIPKDLQASLRSSVLEDLNAPYQPTTMNVVDIDTAWEHLARDSFHSCEILDLALLPVGVAPEMLQ